jgi:hypothetical protein
LDDGKQKRIFKIICKQKICSINMDGINVSGHMVEEACDIVLSMPDKDADEFICKHIGQRDIAGRIVGFTQDLCRDFRKAHSYVRYT